MFWNVNSSPLMVLHLFHHCIITAVLRKTPQCQFLYYCRIIRIQVPSNHQLYLTCYSNTFTMVKNGCSQPFNCLKFEGKKCISKSVLLFIKIFSTAELNRGHSISLLYRLYIKRSNNKVCVCPVPFNLNMLICGINKFGQLPVLNPVIK